MNLTSSSNSFTRVSLGILLLSLISLALACSSGGGGGDEESDSGPTESPSGGDGGPDTAPDPLAQNAIFSLAGTTDSNGRISVTFQLPQFTNKFSVTVESLGRLLRFVSVQNDRGDDYVAPRGEEVSLARDSSLSVKAMNAPSRDVDPAVLDFATYTATAASDPGVALLFTINARTDPNVRNGLITVNVFRVGTAVQRSGAGSSVDDALARMADIWQLQAGISVRINNFEIDGPDSLPSPDSGSEFYLANSAGAPSPAINVFIGGDISIGGSGTLGLAADIPGTPNPSVRSAVAVSLFVSAGPDGRFSDDELRLFGETIAHEMGHYAGLFHPVDIIGSVAAFSDPLSDTADCIAAINCLTNDDLIRNLMFAFTVPEDEESGTTVPQERLTTQQRAVLNLYSAVD